LLIDCQYSKQFKMMFYNSTESYNSTTDYNNSDICHATQKGVTTGVDSEYQFTDCFSIWLSASGTNHGAIDNRIEQAMDLVKSHLMNAVRSEVEELKEKIIRLEDTIINLQGENEVLKRNVPSDVLRQISNTTTPLLAVQQQQQQPTASTALANVGGNQIVQQQSPTTVHPTATLANTTVLSTGVTQVPPTQTNVVPPQTVNVANPPNVVSGVANNQGVANNNTPSQMAPTYMPQSASQHVATVNNQVSTPKPPQ